MEEYKVRCYVSGYVEVIVHARNPETAKENGLYMVKTGNVDCVSFDKIQDVAIENSMGEIVENA